MALDRDRRQGGIVARTFADAADAEAAIRALRDAGFSPDAISVAARDEHRARQVADDSGADAAEGAGIGAATGGVLGALGGLLVGATALTIPGVGILVAGPLAAILGGAGWGAVTGGLAGALAAAGVSDDEAARYQERVESGEILVAVTAGDREPEARQILQAGVYGRERATEVMDVDRDASRTGESRTIIRPEQ